MTKVKVIILAFILATISVVVMFVLGKGVKAVTVQINVKDFPEHGITIIGPSHPDFDSLMASYVRRRPHLSTSTLKPFSIFINNNSSQIIVAYKLRWDLMTANGDTVTKTYAQASTWMLKDSMASKNQELMSNEKSLIKPRATLFFSLAANPEVVEGNDNLDLGLNTFLITEKGGSQNTTQNYDQEEFLKRLNNELAQYKSITISIDGIFFDNGAFIGTDSTGYFNEIEARINAERDVQHMIADDRKLGRTEDQIFTRLGDLAKDFGEKSDINLTPADYYTYYKKMFAKSYLRNTTPTSREKIVKHVLRQLEKKYVKLHKL